MRRTPERVDTVVIGAGHAGLAMSWHLRQASREHVVLERRATLGGGWQDRWDAFRLVTPNWCSSLPGFPYDGDDPDGFMPRDEIAARVARYATVIDAPVRLETGVERLEHRPDGGPGFRLTTTAGPVDADNVIVAVGGFHRPNVPPIAATLPDRIHQVHSHAYRRESDLPPGAVLVVGSGQSGMQIAEELHDAGRRVVLSVGRCGRVPRRYRGKDLFHWIALAAQRGPEVGVGLPTVEMLPDARMRFAGNPHLSGHGGGHDTNLREFGARGMTLIGRLEAIDGERVRIAPDLAENLAFADQFFAERFRSILDGFIAAAGIDAPADEPATFAFDPPEVTDLDLAAEGISSVVWTSGYRLDFSWIDLPILDAQGAPRHVRGVSEVPGLFFLGIPWLHDQSSATLFGATRDAAYLAGQIATGS
jgi:putative flavoprotein involved in K+ transport